MAIPTIYITTSTSPSLSSPRGIAVDKENNQIAICDYGNDRVVLCNADGLEQKNTFSTYDGNTIKPEGIVYYGGHYYVSDNTNHTIIRIRSNDMSYRDHFGTAGVSGNTNALLDSPKGLTTDSEYLYVVDSGNNRILKLNIKTFAYVSQSSNINGVFDSPSDIVYKRDASKALFLSDTANNRVIKFKEDFTYIEQNSTDVTSPTYMAFSNDMLNVGDGSNAILTFSSNGLILKNSYIDTAVILSRPQGIGILRNAMFISDSGNNRITVWRTYRLQDSLTSSSSMKFGAVPLNNPSFIVDVDTITAGETQDYNANYWIEENDNNFSYGWVKESDTTSSWTEE